MVAKKSGSSGGSFFPKNRKAQEMSTNTIIMIILGLVVLVILILGFTIGWNRFLPFLNQPNINNIQSACSLACSTGSTFDFCSTQRDVNDGTTKFSATCNALSDPNGAYKSKNYGIATCPTITCTTTP